MAKRSEMDSDFLNKVIPITVFTLALVAVCQEMEKPKEERKWNGRVAGIVPYDFRKPSLDRLKNACWNPYDSRMLTPTALGLGWSVNFYALLDNLGFFERDVSEESFLMPDQTMREILKQMPASE